MFWASTNPTNRINNAILSSVVDTGFYIPQVVDYYDYDFRNASAFEMLDDAFWETAYSGYNHEDYYDIAQSATNGPVVFEGMQRREHREMYFYPDSLDIDPLFRPLTEPFLKDLSVTGMFYANAVQPDDYINASTLVPSADFSVFASSEFVNVLDNSFEESKDFFNFYETFQNAAFRVPTNFTPIQSYIQILNTFRSDFEEFGPNYDNQLSYTDEDLLNPDNDNSHRSERARFTSPLRLRKTARNSIVTYNAMQKVFRSRFDEGRAHANVGQLAELDSKQPFLTGSRPSYERMLGKNKESFYTTTLYKTTNLKVINDLSSLASSLNFYFYDFPFLAGLERDVSRYF